MKKETPHINKILAVHTTDITRNAPPAIPKEKTDADIQFKDFKPFGSDNLFPHGLAMMNRRGPTHRGIMLYKKIFTLGDGFVADEDNVFLQDFIQMVNQRESMRKMYKKMLNDWFGFGNVYMEIVTDAKRSFMSWFHKDATKARLSRIENQVLFHPDWRKFETFKNLTIKVPLYPEFGEVEGSDDGLLRSIFHFKEYEPEFVDYGIPSWIAAMDAVAIGYKTNKWNLSRLDNSFQTSGLLEIFADPGDKKLKDLNKFLKELHTGEGNNAKIFQLIKQRGGDPTKFTPFVQNSEGEFIELHKQSIADLVTAHNWYRSLSGIADNTGFDTKRIRDEYALASTTVIPETNNFFLDDFKMILREEMNIDPDSLNVALQSPISIIDSLDPNKFVKKGEGRKILGLQVDDTDDRNEEFIDDGTTPQLKLNGPTNNS